MASLRPPFLPEYLMPLFDQAYVMVWVDQQYRVEWSNWHELPEYIDWHVVSNQLLLTVHDHVSLEKPLVWMHCLSDNAQSHPVIKLGSQSKLTFMEVSLSMDHSEHSLDTQTDVVLAPGAALDYLHIQDLNHNSTHSIQLQLQQAQASVFNHTAITLGARTQHQTINHLFTAQESRCSLYGLYVLSGEQQAAYDLCSDHHIGSCISEHHYKGIVADQSRVQFLGKVLIQEQAQNAQSDQINQTLLLGTQATVQTQPILEIYADDVHCHHGATVGQLEEQALFYLQSRGITQLESQQILMWGFLGDLLNHVPHTLCQKIIKTRLEERVHAL